ncbi:hypothetical protein Nepgr_013692 [Nepenthes gracilis]|uniref:Uncharacterized protein n=1 Tax=Nepenthes gracilis TaxID=150966 RepID=A0AAD3XPL3_NEPGR|nr:hypothetical protein Nepgr_013692 [Nepenthes gracilis]
MAIRRNIQDGGFNKCSLSLRWKFFSARLEDVITSIKGENSSFHSINKLEEARRGHSLVCALVKQNRRVQAVPRAMVDPLKGSDNVVMDELLYSPPLERKIQAHDRPHSRFQLSEALTL